MGRLLELHRDQLKCYGGQDGFIDEGVVRSVMNRPLFTSQYVADADIAELGADYMFGFATTQGFSDGNKRTAVVSTLFFMRKNGLNLVVTDQLLYIVAMAVARNEVSREDLSDIIRDHLVDLDPSAD